MKTKDSSQPRVFPETRSVGLFFSLISFNFFSYQKIKCRQFLKAQLEMALNNWPKEMVHEILKEAAGGEISQKKEVSSTRQVGSFSKLKVGELREKLSEQGLSTAGTKPVLVARLKEALQDSSLIKAEAEDSTPVKRIKEEASRASTPTRRSRRLSGSLDHQPALPSLSETADFPVLENPLQEKSSIESITEDTQEQQAGGEEIPRADIELNVMKEQSQSKEAPAQKPKENIPMEKRLDQLFASKSIPRQKPKSGKFWKGERTPFRQIKRGRGKRDRGQKPSFEQRLKMRSGENKTR